MVGRRAVRPVRGTIVVPLVRRRRRAMIRAVSVIVMIVAVRRAAAAESRAAGQQQTGQNQSQITCHGDLPGNGVSPCRVRHGNGTCAERKMSRGRIPDSRRRRTADAGEGKSGPSAGNILFQNITGLGDRQEGEGRSYGGQKKPPAHTGGFFWPDRGSGLFQLTSSLRSRHPQRRRRRCRHCRRSGRRPRRQAVRRHSGTAAGRAARPACAKPWPDLRWQP